MSFNRNQDVQGSLDAHQQRGRTTNRTNIILSEHDYASLSSSASISSLSMGSSQSRSSSPSTKASTSSSATPTPENPYAASPPNGSANLRNLVSGGTHRLRKFQDVVAGKRKKSVEDQSGSTDTVRAPGVMQRVPLSTMPVSRRLYASHQPASDALQAAEPTASAAASPLSLPGPPKKEIDQTLSPFATPSSRGSMLALSPGISGAVSFMVENTTPPTTSASPSPPPAVAATQKENWRKSDSTNSHHTVRPTGGQRGSRPVSWAESFTSAYTVVQSGGSSHGHGSGNGNGSGNPQRRSLLLAEDGMREVFEEEWEDLRLSRVPQKPALPTTTTIVDTDGQPHSRSKSHNRRSMSLSSSGVQAQPQSPPLPPLPSPKQVVDLRWPSHSISEGVKPQPPVSVATTRPAPQRPPTGPPTSQGRFSTWNGNNPSSARRTGTTPTPDHGERLLPTLPTGAAPPGSHSKVIEHAFAHTSQASRQASTSGGFTQGHPQPMRAGSDREGSPYSFRQTAMSMSATASGIGGTAAGLAKRAVEKMQRKLGHAMNGSKADGFDSPPYPGAPSSSGYSSSSGTNSSAMALARTSSNTSSEGWIGGSPARMVHHQPNRSLGFPIGSSPYGHHHKANLSTSTTSASFSDTDTGGMFGGSEGPKFGVLLRPPLRMREGSNALMTGVVFGRPLAHVVRDTRVRRGHVNESEGLDPLVRQLEERELPSVVVRCAQHLLIWGIHEEGLFRVPGRPLHTTRLRAEFDAGVDYDMTGCDPADLDPHAVASVFKAFLRELPEPILTNKLQKAFDAAISAEIAHQQVVKTSLSKESNRATMRPLTGGLPSNPRSGPAPLPGMLKKPPSISTLAMPSFQSIPPPSQTLLATLCTLIRQLPNENKDLLRTLVELLKKTSDNIQENKMPLSNLMVMFCPTLNISPPLFRALCEADSIWDNYDEQVLDKVDRRQGPEEISLDERSSGRPSFDRASDDYHASVEDVGFRVPRPRRRLADDEDWERSEVPTLYLDSRSHCSSTSSVLLSFTDKILPTAPHHTRDGATTDTASFSASSGYEHSVDTPTSSNPSLANVQVMGEEKQPYFQLPSHSPLQKKKRLGPLVVDSTPLELKQADGVHFPSLPSAKDPSTPISASAKRRSIPLLSLPSVFALNREPDSPVESSPRSASSGAESTAGLKARKPSLRLLFSKRSASSLHSNSSRKDLGGHHHLVSPGLASAPSSGSFSSVSTPQSAVTAPQSSLGSAHSSGSSSSLHSTKFPPVLDTPIEGSSLNLNLDFDGDGSPASDSSRLGLSRGGSGFGTMRQRSRHEHEHETNYRDSIISLKTPVGTQFPSSGGDTPVRLRAQKSSSNLSLLSVGSSNGVDEEEEDWASSVLLAAAARTSNVALVPSDSSAAGH